MEGRREGRKDRPTMQSGGERRDGAEESRNGGTGKKERREREGERGGKREGRREEKKFASLRKRK